MTAVNIAGIEEDERALVVRIAQEWAGTPYHHRARIKGVGVDCGQLVAGVFEEAGLIPPVPLDLYPRDWMCHRSEERFLATMERYTRKVERPARPGDIMLFQVGRTISHGAIVIDYPMVIHAVARMKKVVLSTFEQEAKLTKTLRGVWTLKEWT